MNKSELRKSALLKRKQYTDEECIRMSDKISQLFFRDPSVDLSSVSYIHLFLPIEHHHEIDTFPIFHKLLAHYPTINLVLSKGNFVTHTMSHFLYTKDTVLKKNSFGIPEPVSGEEIKPDQIDLVLVPLLVVDSFGNRVGYGKGFYDRFLAACRPDCQKIGLSFENPVSQIQHEDFDIKLDFCVTPDKVYSFRNSDC